MSSSIRKKVDLQNLYTATKTAKTQKALDTIPDFSFTNDKMNNYKIESNILHIQADYLKFFFDLRKVCKS